MLYGRGLRITEALCLRAEDIDFAVLAGECRVGTQRIAEGQVVAPEGPATLHRMQVKQPRTCRWPGEEAALKEHGFVFGAVLVA